MFDPKNQTFAESLELGMGQTARDLSNSTLGGGSFAEQMSNFTMRNFLFGELTSNPTVKYVFVLLWLLFTIWLTGCVPI